jgi:DNA-binding NarL/FixJ family response regulator
MGGQEATADILVRDPQARVIATSGYSTDPIMAHFKQSGFSGRIVKPFQLEDVRKELSRVMGGIEKG